MLNLTTYISDTISSAATQNEFDHQLRSSFPPSSQQTQNLFSGLAAKLNLRGVEEHLKGKYQTLRNELSNHFSPVYSIHLDGNSLASDIQETIRHHNTELENAYDGVRIWDIVRLENQGSQLFPLGVDALNNQARAIRLDLKILSGKVDAKLSERIKALAERDKQLALLHKNLSLRIHPDQKK